MASWFKKRTSNLHLDQKTTDIEQQHPSFDKNKLSGRHQRSQSHIAAFQNRTINNESQFHYLVTTFIESESFHIFASSKLTEIRCAILETIVPQSSFASEIQHLNWSLYIIDKLKTKNHIKLSSDEQLYGYINKQLTLQQTTIRIQMKLIHDQIYEEWIGERKQNPPLSPRIGNIKYGNFSCCIYIQTECGLKQLQSIRNAYKIQYQCVLMEYITDDIDPTTIHISDDNTLINIKNIWPSLQYKCRARFIHNILDIASDWSEWKQNITVCKKRMRKYDEYNLMSYFECMDHEQLKQWTLYKLFGNGRNPLLVYDDEKNEDITRQLCSKIWCSTSEKESGLLSLVQYAIDESALHGKDLLLNDPQDYIKQLLPTELKRNVLDENVDNLPKNKSITDGGYGKDDYLSIIWRLRESAYLEGRTMQYSMNIACYNPYTVFIWIYFLKLPTNKYALYCKDSDSYVLLKHFGSDTNNECHLFLSKYYIRKSAKDVNMSFELHEMVNVAKFEEFNVNINSSKAVLLNGDQDMIIINTHNEQHVIARCYNPKDVITKYKYIPEWHNMFVSRWRMQGHNLPYFECIIDAIFDKIGKEIALSPAIDVLQKMYYWHSLNDKTKAKVIDITAQKLRIKPKDITQRCDIVMFLFYLYWIIGIGHHNNDHNHNILSLNTSNKLIHVILFGEFGGLDRVFPLLRTIFNGSACKYMDKIMKRLQLNRNSLRERMQLLLWLNFMNIIVENKTQETPDILRDVMYVELTPDLMEMVEIDAALEQRTNIKRIYPLERDAFHVLRIESTQKEQIISQHNMDYAPSKCIEKLLSLLLIFKPHFHFIFGEYYIDIVMIIKRERNPIQSLEIMYNVLRIDGDENKKAFMSLVHLFIPNITCKSPLFSVHNDRNESKQYEMIAIKHRLSVLSKANDEMKNKITQHNTKQYMDTIKMLTEQSKTTQDELQIQTVSNQTMMQTIHVITDKNTKSENECIELKHKLCGKDTEIERLKGEMKRLKDTNNVEKARYRPFLGNIEMKSDAIVIDSIDTDALKIDLLNYMKNMDHKPQIFHDMKAQIILNWRSLKSQFYDDFIEELIDFYEERDEIMAYNMGYKVIMECYNFMCKREYSYNPMVFNVIYLNLPLFYGLKMNNKILKMLHNVYRYLDVIINAIGIKEMDQSLKQSMNAFIVHCCNILWSAIHYGYHIGPNGNMKQMMQHRVFDDRIHKKENQGCGDVQCFVFPSLCTAQNSGDMKYETDIWVYCSEL